MINAAAVATRETDVAKANEGNVLVTVSGKFSGDLEKAVKLINKYRKEACNKHYINPATGKKLKKKDYKLSSFRRSFCGLQRQELLRQRL
jgi:hypothetical protein